MVHKQRDSEHASTCTLQQTHRLLFSHFALPPGFGMAQTIRWHSMLMAGSAAQRILACPHQIHSTACPAMPLPAQQAPQTRHRAAQSHHRCCG
jgi:hypothetical protein